MTRSQQTRRRHTTSSPPRSAPWWKPGAWADEVASYGVFCVLWVMTLTRNLGSPAKGNLEFGWEYGRIAEALASGLGFASPFGGDTGPTAWMPPLLPAFMALVFLVLGIKSTASLWLLLLCKCVAITAAVYILLGLLHRSVAGAWRWALLPVLGVYILANRFFLFEYFHDDWLNMLMLAAAAWSLVQMDQETPLADRGTRGAVWMASAALPLSNPMVAAAFGAGCLWIVLRHAPVSTVPPGAWNGRRVGAWALAAMFVASGGWIGRNLVVMDRLYPIKSNAAYDFFQANYVDTDGVPSDAFFTRTHPAVPNQGSREYIRLGEPAFMDHYKARTVEALSADPMPWLRRTVHRAFNALVRLQSQQDLPGSPTRVPAEDRSVLVESGLLYEAGRGRTWACLDLEPVDMDARLQTLPLHHAATVKAEWLEDHQRLRKKMGSIKVQAWGVLMAGLPVLGLGVALARRRTRQDRVLRILACLYTLYLLPYILVSHYERYQWPLIAIQATFLVYGACALRDLLGHRLGGSQTGPHLNGNQAAGHPQEEKRHG